MEELDIPILRACYDLYKSLHGLRNLVPKADRHTLWQRIESLVLGIIEGMLLASQLPKDRKLPHLEHASAKLNLLRLLLRLAKDTKIIDLKKYAALQQSVDEVGRMLGGWIKSTRNPENAGPPPEGFLSEERRKCRTDPDPMLSFALPFQLLKLSWSPFHLTLTQLLSAV